MLTRMGLVTRFVELADTAVPDFDVAEFTRRLVRDVVEVFDAPAGVMLNIGRDELAVIAASDPRMHSIEVLQLESFQGPGPDAFNWCTQVQAITADAQDRWPVFAPQALLAGYRAVSAFPMRCREQVIGVLDIFRTEPCPLSVDDTATAQALADLADLALLQHQALREARRHVEQLQEEMTTRIGIEAAKGMLAERTGLSLAAAGAALGDYAQTTGKALAGVAAALIAGRIPAEAILSTPTPGPPRPVEHTGAADASDRLDDDGAPSGPGPGGLAAWRGVPRRPAGRLGPRR